MRERQVCDMGGGIYSTGNTIVDENAKLNISGNIIPQTWYRTVVRESGKPNLTAIVILADIVYWYRPTEIRDESTGQVVALKKKFKADLLHRSYQQISEQFGISKKEATNAIIFLEKLRVVKRVFRTITINGLVINNVLYLELVVSRLRELTYPEEKSDVSASSEGERPEEKDTTCLGGAVRQTTPYEKGAVSFERERVSPFRETPVTARQREDALLEGAVVSSGIGTNTENITKTIPENTPEINIRDNPLLSYQTATELFKDQIDFDAIWMDRPYDRSLLMEIVSIAVDVLTSTARTIRINREDKPVPVVQNIYRKLDKGSVEFVMDSITNCTSRAANIRAVIITALYNATMTVSSYFTNLLASHTIIPQT